MDKVLSLLITMVMITAPSAAQTVQPSVTPAATAAPVASPTVMPSAIHIEYDDTNERQAHYARYFKINNTEHTDGSYIINYTLETFLEGRGTVTVSFRCLDRDGNTVDTFGSAFVGTDYTWSRHERTATISDKTVKIELVLN